MSGRLRRLFRGESNIDFIGRRKLWFLISGGLFTASVILLLTKGLNYGIEFEGGVQINAPVPADGPLGDASDTDVISEVRDAVADFGASDAQIQIETGSEGRTVLLQSKEVADPEVQDDVVAAVRETVGAGVGETDSNRVGSTWGDEITDKAARALVIFMIVVTGFIALRFEWKMAVGAITALVHDLTVTAGIYSLVGFEVSPSSVIAILTILGYSLYDTVVVFDKVEENTELYATAGKMTYQDSANLALNQVFMRSLNTSLATLLPVAALLFVGAGLLAADTLKDLALALFVGLMTGAYSSVFLATPLLSWWKEREPRYKSVREKVLKESMRAPAVAIAGVGPGSGPAAEEVAATAAPRQPTTPRPARPRAGSKKARRRRRR
ncbi:MAG: protein translocase subunit SecF [Actinomycetota bacterium]